MAKPGLAKKITTTLIVVSVLSVITSTIFMLLMTRQQFSSYINQYDQAMLDQWQPIVSDYYAKHGADGLQEYLESNMMGNGMSNGMGKRRGAVAMGMRMKQGQRLVVTDMHGVVQTDTRGLLIGQTARPLKFRECQFRSPVDWAASDRNPVCNQSAWFWYSFIGE
jgi:ABC-type lipoprotein release transport system permease subunit